MTFYTMPRLVLFVVSAVLAIAPALAFADGIDVEKGQAELRAAVNALRPQPSTDTTPVDLTIVGIHYRIPRNYIISLDNWSGGNQYIIGLKINITDFAPFNEGNRPCFTARFPSLLPNCEPLQFRIQGIGPPTAEQAFQNVRRLFINQEPKEGPYGFELYEIGSEDPRIEYYKIFKYGRVNLYSCTIFQVSGNKNGICDPVSDETKSGPVIHYGFPLRMIETIPEIDKNIRDIVESFVVKTGH